MQPIIFGSKGVAKRKSHQRVSRRPLAAFADPDSKEQIGREFESHEARLQEAAALQEQGNAKAENGEFSAALKLWDQALYLDPDKAELHELKAQIFMAVDQLWEAIKCATKATELKPSWAEGHLTLSRAQLEFGQPEAALQSMQTVLKLQPTHEEGLAELGRLQLLALQAKQNSQSVNQPSRTGL